MATRFRPKLKVKGLSAPKRVKAEQAADALDNSGGVVDKNLITKNGKVDPEGMQAVKNVYKNVKPGDIPKGAVKKNLQNISEVMEDVPNGRIAKITDSSLAETAKALKSSESFFKKNQGKFVAAGISAAGLATYMLLTGEKNPIKALGGALGEVAKAGGEAAGAGLDSFLDSSGLKDLFKKFGVYIIGFIAVVIVIIIGSQLL